MKLIILGNGFDLANDLPTKYSDFFGYLVQKKEVEFNKIIEFIENYFSFLFSPIRTFGKT